MKNLRNIVLIAAMIINTSNNIRAKTVTVTNKSIYPIELIIYHKEQNHYILKQNESKQVYPSYALNCKLSIPHLPLTQNQKDGDISYDVATNKLVLNPATKPGLFFNNTVFSLKSDDGVQLAPQESKQIIVNNKNAIASLSNPIWLNGGPKSLGNRKYLVSEKYSPSEISINIVNGVPVFQ